MSYKKKRGRKLTSPEIRDNLITIRLNETELKCLTQYCWRYDVSMSETIRDALEILGILPVNPLR